VAGAAVVVEGSTGDDVWVFPTVTLRILPIPATATGSGGECNDPLAALDSAPLL
jgi:hypothetical protein